MCGPFYLVFYKKVEKMNTEEIANQLYGFIKKGEEELAQEALYAEDIVSIEPQGSPNEKVKGIEAVKKKKKEFSETIEKIHSSNVSGPIVSNDHFAISMGMDVSFKDGNRIQLSEICLYKVNKGKIVEEQFFFEIPEN